MKVKVNTDFERLQLKCRDAYYFIDAHPAINVMMFGVQQSIWHSIQTVCKRAYSEDAIRGVSVYNTGKNAKRFKKQFELERKEDEDFYDKYPSLIKIEVPYEELYGEPWKFDHIEYWGELTYHIYDTNSTAKEKDRWLPWSGCSASGRTYEEMIINLAKALKKNCGNFGYDSFMTDKELKNNKEHLCFFLEPIEDTKAYKYMTELIHNPKFITVTDAQKNIRWQEWMLINKEKTFNW